MVQTALSLFRASGHRASCAANADAYLHPAILAADADTGWRWQHYQAAVAAASTQLCVPSTSYYVDGDEVGGLGGESVISNNGDGCSRPCRARDGPGPGLRCACGGWEASVVAVLAAAVVVAAAAVVVAVVVVVFVGARPGAVE